MPERQRDPRLRAAEVPGRGSRRPGPRSRRRPGTRRRRSRRRPGSASSARPAARRRSPAPRRRAARPRCSRHRSLRRRSRPRRRRSSASIGVPSIATVAVTRWTRSAARVALTCRRGPRARVDDDPTALVDRARAARVQAPERVERARVGLRHVVGRLDRPGEDDDDARRPASAGADAATERRRAGSPARRSPACSAVRIAPVTTIGFGPAWRRSKKNAVSSIVSVPWTTTAPSIVRIGERVLGPRRRSRTGPRT